MNKNVNKIRVILLVLIASFCFSSAVFAQQKEGFFIGWSQPLIGSGNIEVETNTSAVPLPGGTFTIPATTTRDELDVDFKSGYGIKAGWNFKDFRVYYSNYNLAYKDTTTIKNMNIKANVVATDWTYQNFFVGLGYGKASFDAKLIRQSPISISESGGTVTALNFGYDYNINESFKISAGYLIARFNFEFDKNLPQSGGINIPANFKIKAGGDALYIDAIYSF